MPNKTRQIKAHAVAVTSDIKTGVVSLIFESGTHDVEIQMHAFEALDVGLKVLAGAKSLIDTLLAWAKTRGETIQ